ncbi:hypothetical protein [Nocardioides marmoribigeumensis]|uniref:LysM domain-containing protein n=1 Tax=Nocardioides marmoribigeumensis TaxID=433649 RepID=A0ABU2C047_9ACTN|nr:hypothetical protein [Nocardioides marmoribigeumensis]MDR7364033.1 hypothetical protein [Nocardioides marmoribigeumensis]
MSPTSRGLRLVLATGALQSLAVAATTVSVRGLRAAAATLVGPGHGAGLAPGDPARVSAALEATAWTGMAICGAWFAAAVLACARDLGRHPSRPAPRAARACLRPAFVRSLLVVLVGGCLTTPGAQPVADHPAHPRGWGLLDGLPLPGLPTGAAPERAAHPRETHRHPRVAPRTVTARPGDCLWSITATLLGPSASDGQVARAWPRLHRLNRATLGPDPDVLVAGARLVVPDGWRAATSPGSPDSPHPVRTRPAGAAR